MKILFYMSIAILFLSSCKKKDVLPTDEVLSENQQKIQGKWTKTYFKRYDYENGTIYRVVEGSIKTGEYAEFYGKNYRYYDGSKMLNEGSTFSFQSGELAIRIENMIFYSTIKWQSPDAFTEVLDDGSSAGGPANKSVFEYSYVRK